jgi:hypothetical protein
MHPAVIHLRVDEFEVAAGVEDIAIFELAVVESHFLQLKSLL